MPEPAGKRTVRDQLRRKLEELRSGRADAPGAGDAESNVVRMSRRPRRVPDEPAAGPPKAWEENAPGDPPPTRPVLRSELQAETGAWPVPPPAPAPGTTHGGDLVELDAWQRRRAGAPGPRRVRPRRVVKPDEDGPSAT